MTDIAGMVARLVDEVMNRRNLDLLDELCTPQLAPKLRTAFEAFLVSFPDWHQEVVEVVADDATVVARFRCHGTHLGPWEGVAASGRTMAIDEVHPFRFAGDRIRSMWGLEDTWTRMRQLAGDDVTLGASGSLSEPVAR